MTTGETKQFLDLHGLQLYNDIINDKLGTKVGSSTIRTIWRGTQAEYDALSSYDNNTLYVITQ